jgi:hypothetical protein
VELPHLTVVAALMQSPCPAPPQVTLGQSRALREHVSKHNRRTAEKNLRTTDWRGESSIMMKNRRHTFFYLMRKKYLLKLFLSFNLFIPLRLLIFSPYIFISFLF